MKLETKVVQLVLSSQFPELGDISCAPGSEGWDFFTFRVDGGLTFRFPKTADSETRLLREARVLPRISTRLPVLIPRYSFIGAPSPHFPFRFAGYATVPGLPLSRIPKSRARSTRLPIAVGKFLRQLHRVRLGGRFFRTTPRILATHSVAAHIAKARRDLARIRFGLPRHIYISCVEALGANVSRPSEYSGSPRLLHGDFKPDHILISARIDGRIGIIDWSDLALGDPAVDYSWLWIRFGDNFVKEALLLNHDYDPLALFQRARLFGICRAIGELSYGLPRSRWAILTDCLAALRRAR